MTFKWCLWWNVRSQMHCNLRKHQQSLIVHFNCLLNILHSLTNCTGSYKSKPTDSRICASSRSGVCSVCPQYYIYSPVIRWGECSCICSSPLMLRLLPEWKCVHFVLKFITISFVSATFWRRYHPTAQCGPTVPYTLSPPHSCQPRRGKWSCSLYRLTTGQ